MLTRLSTDALLSFGTLTGEPWDFWLNTFSTASLESNYRNINIYLSTSLIVNSKYIINSNNINVNNRTKSRHLLSYEKVKF